MEAQTLGLFRLCVDLARKKMFGDKPNILETVAFHAETVQHAYGGEKSPRMITWLKIKDLGLEDTFLGRKIIETEKERFETYFGKDHPLTKIILDKR